MNLWNRIEKALGQGLDASREVLDKAREGAKDLSEKACSSSTSCSLSGSR